MNKQWIVWPDIQAIENSAYPGPRVNHYKLQKDLMNLDTYPVESSDDLLTNHFVSNGPKGPIKKRIEFQEFKAHHFNLAFGDWNEEYQQLNDMARSDNNDLEKILFTIADVVDDFLQFYPLASIEVEGSTTSRTRLYQMKIFQNLKKINEHYTILGYKNGIWESIDTACNYSSFYITTQNNYHENK